MLFFSLIQMYAMVDSSFYVPSKLNFPSGWLNLFAVESKKNKFSMTTPKEKRNKKENKNLKIWASVQVCVTPQGETPTTLVSVFFITILCVRSNERLFHHGADRPDVCA